MLNVKEILRRDNDAHVGCSCTHVIEAGFASEIKPLQQGESS